MGRFMTKAEIYAQFPSEWVLLNEPQVDTYQGVQGGTLLWHSKDRDEVYSKALEVPVPRNIAFLYTGPVPPPGKAILI